MTKADVIAQISKETSIEKAEVTNIVESFMQVVKTSMTDGNDIFIRGFGTFVNKKKAQKIGRVITRNTPVVIPERYVPTFKPCKEFKEQIKASKKIKGKKQEK